MMFLVVFRWNLYDDMFSVGVAHGLVATIMAAACLDIFSRQNTRKFKVQYFCLLRCTEIISSRFGVKLSGFIAKWLGLQLEVKKM